MTNRIKPIRDEADYDAALKEIRRLWGAKAGTARADRLDVLIALVEVYEDRQYPVDPPDPIDAIEFRMESQGLTRQDLEQMVGPRSRVSEVLSRKRALSIAMIRRLHEKLGIIRPTLEKMR